MGNSYKTIAFYQDKCDGCGDCVPACSKHHT
ncbi:MAG: 4Fe-4S binding protein, partial [Deltaproteobacteria bacterium]|nr:4Fe-4S binding protein [Deltaproteobacteria bacterium]